MTVGKFQVVRSNLEPEPQRGGGLMTTNRDFWGLKIMGTRGKFVDLIHHLSPKVPMIFLGYFALDVEISLKYDSR